MPAVVPVTPLTTPAVSWVNGETGTAGAAALTSAMAMTNDATATRRSCVEATATNQAPSTDPGTRPPMIHASPVRSTSARSWRNIEIEIDVPSTITATGRASGATMANTGTDTRFMPNPIAPWMAAPTRTATTRTAKAPRPTSTPSASGGGLAQDPDRLGVLDALDPPDRVGVLVDVAPGHLDRTREEGVGRDRLVDEPGLDGPRSAVALARQQGV